MKKPYEYNRYYFMMIGRINIYVVFIWIVFGKILIFP